MSEELVQFDWPGGFRAYQAVIVRDGEGEDGREAHVIPLKSSAVKDCGCVPVIFDDESECFNFVPVDDLELRFAESQDS